MFGIHPCVRSDTDQAPYCMRSSGFRTTSIHGGENGRAYHCKVRAGPNMMAAKYWAFRIGKI
eukprot:scaffold178308_cov36-Tisochrysis_lutea.AAC.3